MKLVNITAFHDVSVAKIPQNWILPSQLPNKFEQICKKVHESFGPLVKIWLTNICPALHFILL